MNLDVLNGEVSVKTNKMQDALSIKSVNATIGRRGVLRVVCTLWKTSFTRFADFDFPCYQALAKMEGQFGGSEGARF